MGYYTDRILPRITDVVLRTKPFGEIRREVCEGLHGDVLEIGFGSGLNMPYLPPEVTGVWTVEPSDVAMRLAGKRIVAAPVPVHVGGSDGERLDFPDDRFDAALSTMTLCTIPDVGAALREVHRVLAPGGVYHFAEHGHSPDDRVARTQERMNGIQMRIAGGCHLNRDIEALVAGAGFEIESARHFYLAGPKAWGYMTVGRARKA